MFWVFKSKGIFMQDKEKQFIISKTKKGVALAIPFFVNLSIKQLLQTKQRFY
jgi:hypothetical protein